MIRVVERPLNRALDIPVTGVHMLPKAVAWIAIAFVSSSGLAAGESYMSLVGQLYGAVELPRLAKDHCGKVQPSLTAPITEAYEVWAKRNAAVLGKAREQLSRADARARKEGVSLSQFDEMLRGQFRSLDAKQFCQRYADLLSSKERQFNSDVKQLLDAVTYADAELSKRGE